MGIAQELATSQSKGVAQTPAPAAADPAPAEPIATVPPAELAVIDPASQALLEQGLGAVEPGTAAVTPETKPETPKESFMIGDQSFDSLEAVMKHAQKLEREKGERDAYDLGKREAHPKGEEKKELKVPIEAKIKDMLFENPEEALKLYRESIISEVTSTITQSSKQESEKTAAWNSFYETNPDLLEHRELVDFVLEKNWGKLGVLEATQGLEQLATITKAKLKAIAQSQLPTTILPDGAAKVSTTTGEVPQVVQSKKENLTFAQQLRMLNKRQLKV